MISAGDQGFTMNAHFFVTDNAKPSSTAAQIEKKSGFFTRHVKRWDSECQMLTIEKKSIIIMRKINRHQVRIKNEKGFPLAIDPGLTTDISA